jgi:hypothetical protein
MILELPSNFKIPLKVLKRIGLQGSLISAAIEETELHITELIDRIDLFHTSNHNTVTGNLVNLPLDSISESSSDSSSESSSSPLPSSPSPSSPSSSALSSCPSTRSASELSSEIDELKISRYPSG